MSKSCEIEFVQRDYQHEGGRKFDAVLDVGRVHDNRQLFFDHKPPAFQHRDDHCAASLVWEHAKSVGCRVDTLRNLVEVVHDGDAAIRRGKSDQYQQSRENGLHAIVKATRNYAETDRMLYRGIAAYLDVTFHTDVKL